MNSLFKRVLPALAILGWLAASPGAFGARGGRARALSPVGRVGDYGLCSLDADIYAHARPDLADLRVIDAEGGLVPAVVLYMPPAPRTACHGMLPYGGDGNRTVPWLRGDPDSWPAPLSWPAKVHTGMSEDGRTQTVLLDLGGTVPVDEIALKIGTRMFHRRLTLEKSVQGEEWQWVAGREIYRYRRTGEFLERTMVTWDGGPIRTRYLRLLIENGADRPLEISGVKVSGRPDVIAFSAAESKGFALVCGMEETEPARFDLQKLLPGLPAGDFSRWTLEPPRHESEASNRRDPWLYPVIILCALAMAGAAALALRQIGRAPKPRPEP